MDIPQENRYQTGLFVLGRFVVLMAFICGNVAFAQQSGPMVLVDSAKEVALIEEVPITGSVISVRIAKLSTEVSGIVERMAIEIGDQVGAGDEILQLNSELDRLSLAAARAATEKAIAERQGRLKAEAVSPR